MGEVEWGPAVAFLAAGLVVGALILWRVLRRAPATPAARAEDSLERRDLLARLDGLVNQLRELEDTGIKRTAAQHRDERFLLELQAARTVLALDALAAPSAAQGKKREPAEAVAPARGSALTGFFWGVGSAAALGLLFFFVSQSSKPRAPGGSVTGNTPMEGGAAPAPAAAEDSAEVAALEARVRQNPEDVGARLDLARLHLMREDMMAVYNETQAVLQRDPENPRALAYQSLVRLAMGQGDQAEEMLVRALRKDPDLLEGYLHLMFVYTRVGKPRQAEATMKRAAERFPDRAESLRRLLAQMQAPPADEQTSAAGAAGGANGPAPPPASSGGGRSVSGVIDLDPAARAALRPGAIVFVMLRESGFGAGPPLAARRLPASAFPLAFEIGQADAMAGGQVPDDVLVEARLDSDGDPLTRPPSDPYGREDHVKIGTRGLHLVLSPRPQN
ncbi:MAG TPA: tetratricopeptide repeat protein [Vicinamibacteria bacterium]|nr:tetratricopeptide repeat protein [Vicinamibacteria bacterium]